MKRELPKFVKCPKCKAEIPFPIYVYAHWDIVLETVCPQGHEFKIRRGRIFR